MEVSPTGEKISRVELGSQSFGKSINTERHQMGTVSWGRRARAVKEGREHPETHRRLPNQHLLDQEETSGTQPSTNFPACSAQPTPCWAGQ